MKADIIQAMTQICFLSCLPGKPGDPVDPGGPGKPGGPEKEVQGPTQMEK